MWLSGFRYAGVAIRIQVCWRGYQDSGMLAWLSGFRYAGVAIRIQVCWRGYQDSGMPETGVLQLGFHMVVMVVEIESVYIIIYIGKPHINHKYPLVIITPRIFSSQMLYFG